MAIIQFSHQEVWPSSGGLSFCLVRCCSLFSDLSYTIQNTSLYTLNALGLSHERKKGHKASCYLWLAHGMNKFFTSLAEDEYSIQARC